MLCVVVRQPGGAFHLANDRVKRAVLVVRRAEIAQTRVWFAGKMVQKGGGKPRFPDACLARDQDHLPIAGLCPGRFFPTLASWRERAAAGIFEEFLENAHAAPMRSRIDLSTAVFDAFAE